MSPAASPAQKARRNASSTSGNAAGLPWKPPPPSPRPVQRLFQGAGSACQLADHHNVRRCHPAPRRQYLARQPDCPGQTLRHLRAAGAHRRLPAGARGLAACTGQGPTFLLHASPHPACQIRRRRPADLCRRRTRHGTVTGGWFRSCPVSARAERQNLRRELKWLGFGQISPTLLAHPAADDGAVEALFDGSRASHKGSWRFAPRPPVSSAPSTIRIAAPGRLGTRPSECRL